MNNALIRLQEFDQSPWFDYIRHTLLTSGELKKMIEQDGLKGVTSNPAIFEKAIAGSSDYAEILPKIRKTQEPKAVYEALAIGDVRLAADIMWPVYEATQKDRWLCQPRGLALPGQRHAGDDRRSAPALESGEQQANVMIKVPATPEGIPADPDS
jgi:transaldolase